MQVVEHLGWRRVVGEPLCQLAVALLVRLRVGGVRAAGRLPRFPGGETVVVHL